MVVSQWEVISREDLPSTRAYVFLFSAHAFSSQEPSGQTDGVTLKWWLRVHSNKVMAGRGDQCSMCLSRINITLQTGLFTLSAHLQRLNPLSQSPQAFSLSLSLSSRRGYGQRHTLENESLLVCIILHLYHHPHSAHILSRICPFINSLLNKVEFNVAKRAAIQVVGLCVWWRATVLYQAKASSWTFEMIEQTTTTTWGNSKICSI